MALDKFPLVPHGSVKLTFSWNSDKTEFENGACQYKRKRVRAKKVYSFTVSGLKKDMNTLINFYNTHRGELDKFLFSYDGVEEECYFSSVLSMDVKNEVGKIIGYSCKVEIEVATQVTVYPAPATTDVLIVGKCTNESYDWNTTLVTTSTTQRRLKNITPIRKITCTFGGLKPARDRLISLYNSHEMIPLKYKYNGTLLSVRFPSSLEIEDKRENNKIVGFSCECELEVLG